MKNALKGCNHLDLCNTTLYAGCSDGNPTVDKHSFRLFGLLRCGCICMSEQKRFPAALD